MFHLYLHLSRSSEASKCLEVEQRHVSFGFGVFCLRFQPADEGRILTVWPLASGKNDAEKLQTKERKLAASQEVRRMSWRVVSPE